MPPILSRIKYYQVAFDRYNDFLRLWSHLKNVKNFYEHYQLPQHKRAVVFRMEIVQSAFDTDRKIFSSEALKGYEFFSTVFGSDPNYLGEDLPKNLIKVTFTYSITSTVMKRLFYYYFFKSLLFSYRRRQLPFNCSFNPVSSTFLFRTKHLDRFPLSPYFNVDFFQWRWPLVIQFGATSLFLSFFKCRPKLMKKGVNKHFSFSSTKYSRENKKRQKKNV